MNIDIGLYKTIEGYKVNVFAKIPDSANYIAAISIPSCDKPYFVEYYPSGIRTNTTSNVIVDKWVEPVTVQTVLRIHKGTQGLYACMGSESVNYNELARCVVTWEEGKGFYI